MNKGFFYTIGVVLLAIPLILLIAYYATIPQTKMEDTISKVRCDELHYFVEDVRMDLERALVIFGRRAAIYSINEVVDSGRPLDNYVFNCTAGCPVECGTFVFEDNGSEAAIAELVMCGTLHGSNISYMTNHTLNQWISRIVDHGRERHFNLTLTINDILIQPRDAWTFTSISNSTFSVSDESGTCYYRGEGVLTSSDTSIIGLEDPLYPLHTDAYVAKFIDNCTTLIQNELSAGCSAASEDPGAGDGTGDVVFDSTLASPSNYCLTTPPDIINHQILVLDKGFGSCNQYDDVCFNLSHPNHFAGILDYGPNSPQSFVNKCNVTIPWLRDTGHLTNDSKWKPRVLECALANLSAGLCVQIKNDADCTPEIHAILIGLTSSAINTTCYRVSNASLAVYGGYDGPSFFDRLDGRLRLSEKYSNQSLARFNVTHIGIETLVSPYELNWSGVDVNTNTSWVDYMYWNNTGGCNAQGICGPETYMFRLDDAHARVYGVDTSCVNASVCPVSSEVCVDNVDQDYDSKWDWEDPDCLSFFGGCGEIRSCDPSETDDCAVCEPGAAIAPNSTSTCQYYGYDASEWHFYNIVADATGRLTVEFTGSSPANGQRKTDFNIYNVTQGGCTTHIRKDSNIEPNKQWSQCIVAGENYTLALDVDVTSSGDNGSYVMRTYVNPDASCTPGSTTTTTTTTSTTTTTTTEPPCGYFDDMESCAGWTEAGRWGCGVPEWPSPNSAHSGSNSRADVLKNKYQKNVNESVTSQAISLKDATISPRLSYWVKYNIEYLLDHGYAEVSADGMNWTTLATYTNPSSANLGQDWAQESFNLGASYIGKNLTVRFRLETNNVANFYGLFIDDVNVTCS